MRYRALACDYDGTIAKDGHVHDTTVNALIRLRESGRKLLLVTGRELTELKSVFPHLEIFDRVVVENGAILYYPHEQQERLLAGSPPDGLLTELQHRGVSPISAGHSIVATRDDHLATVYAIIRDLKLAVHVILNKGAVMIMPVGIGKTSGFTAAIGELELSADAVVGVGDAENDEGFLKLCGCAVAVANALPSVKKIAHMVLQSPNGTGVCDLVRAIVNDELPATVRAKEVGSPGDKIIDDKIMDDPVR
jgi:hydroxymethylpyrimidine pyrophosphatase-like HAD family hydrolase